VQTVAAPEKPPAPPLLTAEQLRRFDGYVPGPNPLLRERLAATRERFSNEPGGSSSIELFVTDNSDPGRTERFLMRARELVPISDVYVIPVVSGPRYRLMVSYGIFASKEAAAEAAKRLPPKYQNAFKFELRGMSELRALI
jgi:MSHA biogenesis protein MshM